MDQRLVALLSYPLYDILSSSLLDSVVVGSSSIQLQTHPSTHQHLLPQSIILYIYTPSLALGDRTCIYSFYPTVYILTVLPTYFGFSAFWGLEWAVTSVVRCLYACIYSRGLEFFFDLFIIQRGWLG